ncbi:MAG: lysostaphin resistance A-like protein [Candidatus Odinarchaeota archaeon]
MRIIASWWRIPAFHVLLGIFGLSLATEIMVSVAPLFIPLLIDVYGQDNSIHGLVRVITARSLQLVIIAIIITKFDNYGHFRLFPAVKSEQETTVVQNLVEDAHQQGKHRFLAITGFIALITVSLSILDTATNYLLYLLKTLLGFPLVIVSPYSELSDTWEVFIVFSLVITFFAPFHEELLWRGYLQQALDRSGTADWVHYAFQGIGFAFLHLPGDILGGASLDFVILHMIGTGSFGIAATWLKKKYRSILYPMVLHGSGNGLTALYTYISRVTGEETEGSLYLLLLLLSAVICGILLLLLYLSRTWRPGIPAILKNGLFDSKNASFLVLMVAVMVVIELVLDIIILSSLRSYLLVLLVACVAITMIYVIWGYYGVKDVKWIELFR